MDTRGARRRAAGSGNRAHACRGNGHAQQRQPGRGAQAARPRRDRHHPDRRSRGAGKALAEHLPPDAIVLAWQDVSRHLHLSEEASASFGWPDALLAPRDEGIRQLREHAGDSTVHLVVHVRDALLLGAMAPERIGVAFQDQPDAGNLHGSINNARDWVRKEGYKAYSAYRPDTTRLRIVALTDDASAATLIGSLLPFHDPRRQAEPVQGLTLVHQVGGFWVYRVEPDAS